MHNTHRSWKRGWQLALFLLAAIPSIASAQGGSITGRITEDKSGRPVEQAQVNIVGTTIGGLTNADGRYSLRGIRAGAYQLRVLRVGYAETKQSVTVTEGQPTTANFTLATVAVNLTPVVTTATGEQRRIEIGNATANIDASKVMESAPIANASDLLNSRARRRLRDRRLADGHRRAHPRARHELDQPEQRADLDHRRHPDDERQRQLLHGDRQRRLGQHRRQQRQPRGRHRSRADREHRDREGPVGRDAVRHRRRERRDRGDDQARPCRRAAVVALRRAAA